MHNIAVDTIKHYLLKYFAKARHDVDLYYDLKVRVTQGTFKVFGKILDASNKSKKYLFGS